LVSDGVSALALATAAAIEPQTAMWLSLSRSPSSSRILWLRAPPTHDAYFDRARKPGIVLRVSISVAPVPSTSRAYSAVRVAIPVRS